MSKLFDLRDVASLLYYFIPLKWMFTLARLHGRLKYHVRRNESLTVKNNYLTYFSKTRAENEINLMTRQFFEYQQLRGLLLTLAQHLSVSRISELFPMEGIEHLDKALAQKKGVILLGCHLNSVCMFIAIMMLKRLGYDVRVAMSDASEPWAPTALQRIINRFMGLKTFSELISAFYSQFNIRPLMRCLADNVIVGQTGDGWHSARFVEVEFLGRLLPFTTGMMSVAQLAGSAVVPFFAVGTPPDKLRFIMEKPFTIEKCVHSDREIQTKVSAYVKRLEHHLLENIPCWEHWLIENTLDTMVAWPQQSLDKRYSFER